MMDEDSDEAPVLVQADTSNSGEPVEQAVTAGERETPPPVPVTLLTGWLGSGKTTLLNYILNETHGKRIAVIENEFAEGAGIENAMVTGADGEIFEEFYELPNGCICCSVRSDLVMALESLMEKRHKFDYILIETTGLADPGPIASTLWLDKQLESSVGLDAIVSVVDAKHILMRLDEPRPDGAVNEVQRQVAFADVLLINKMDLVTEEEAAAVIARVRTLNKIAKLITCNKCKVDLSEIIGIGAYDLERAQAVDPATFGLQPPQADGHGHGHGHGHDGAAGHGSSRHDPVITSVLIEEPGSVDLTKFNYWVGELLWEQGEANIYRTKGLMAVHGQDQKVLFQGVATLFDTEPAEAWGPDEARGCRLVFIGRSLDEAKMRQGLRACIV